MNMFFSRDNCTHFELAYYAPKRWFVNLDHIVYGNRGIAETYSFQLESSKIRMEDMGVAG